MKAGNREKIGNIISFSIGIVVILVATVILYLIGFFGSRLLLNISEMSTNHFFGEVTITFAAGIIILVMIISDFRKKRNHNKNDNDS